MAVTAASMALPAIRVPAVATLTALALGLLSGLLVGETYEQVVLAIAEPIGTLWLNALKMTILPLVAGLMFTGIVDAVMTARAGAMARRTLVLFAAILTTGAVFAAVAMPALLVLFPVPRGHARPSVLEGQAAAGAEQVPGIGDFIGSLVTDNVLAAASEGAMLPVVVFVALFALAASRLAEPQRHYLSGLFQALAGAMIVMVGWVLRVAPLGVFALAIELSVRNGGAAIGALAHYIALVVTVGAAVLIAAYLIGALAARGGFAAFARSILPAQAVAISTQSSLASLPAMLASCRALGVRGRTSEFTLPLAIALFRATSPAMNVAVAVYAASMADIELSTAALAAGVLVAAITTYGTVSLPGTISFIASVGPVAVAMGVPIEPLALLVAVEVLPDMMRTLANVTMDVAVTAVVDRPAGPRDGQLR